MFKLFSVLLPCFALLAYSAEEGASLQLKPVGRISKANGNALKKPIDIVLSPAGHAYVLQKDKRTVAKYDMQGHFLSEFGKPERSMRTPAATLLPRKICAACCRSEILEFVQLPINTTSTFDADNGLPEVNCM